MRIDRIFLDANVLFSVAYGSPGLRNLWRLSDNKQCLLLASGYVIEEARRNLKRADQSERLQACLGDVQIVPEADPEVPCPISLQEKDRAVLMAAISAKADYLLTGDKMHFGEHFGRVIAGVKIMMPREYIMRKAPHRRSSSKN